MNISEWAKKYSITPNALYELSVILQPEHIPKALGVGMSEEAVSQRIKLAASKKGIRLFRNNVGAAKDINGRMIRYGLCNESAAINKECKSADLIGITSITVKSHHVGTVIGVFTSIEVKKSEWKSSGKGPEVAQNHWKNVIRSLGGIALIANDEKIINDIYTL